MSKTDEIYRELRDELEKGLDWQQFLEKHSDSKGPLYNAIGRFIRDMEPKVKELSEVQGKVGAAEQRLDSLGQKIKEAERNITSLEDRKNALNKQVTTLEAELTEKSDLLKHLAELERLGFNIERLNLLRDTLRQTGEKHGLNSKETVSKFFGALKEYDLILGAEVKLQGFQTQIETKKLEVENWRAKEEALKRKHHDLKEAVEAVQTLLGKGIKVVQVITWRQILNRFETVEQFEKNLAKYGDITKLLKARREEAENCELRLAKAQGEMETMQKERAKIEGAIDTLKVAGVNQLKTMTAEAANQLKVVAASAFSQIDALAKKAFQTGEVSERNRQELQKYDGVRQVLESHANAEDQ